jgi:hypothetical protein
MENKKIETKGTMEYISNKSLLNEIIKYKETGVQREELGRMLLLLAKRYSMRSNFAGYTWKDDMISEAVMTCVKYMHNCKIDIKNPQPFWYFSKIIYHSFLNYIAKQKTHIKIKDICYKNLDFIVPDENVVDDKKYFEISGIDYQLIRGNKKKKKRKKT